MEERSDMKKKKKRIKNEASGRAREGERQRGRTKATQRGREKKRMNEKREEEE